MKNVQERNQMPTRAHVEIIVYSGIGHGQVVRDSKYNNNKRMVKNRVQVQIRKSDIARYKGAGRNRKQEQSWSQEQGIRCADNQRDKADSKNQKPKGCQYKNLKLTGVLGSQHWKLINVLTAGVCTDLGLNRQGTKQTRQGSKCEELLNTNNVMGNTWGRLDNEQGWQKTQTGIRDNLDIQHGSD